MSGLARLSLELGYKVSGSDLKESFLTERLKNMGADIYIGHTPRNLNDTDLVVYSSSIKEDNPEIVAVKEKGLPLIQRACMLAELMRNKIGITVTGTHGKTTTTSLISHIISRLGLEPSVCVGAEVFSLGGNALSGKGDYFVAEADESDESFLYLRPAYSVITNIEEEHLDYYKNLDEIFKAYLKFAQKTKDEGYLFVFSGDNNIRRLLLKYNGEVVTFGFDKESDFRAQNIKMEGMRSEFDCLYKNKDLGRFLLNIPGKHNIANALASLAVTFKLGLKMNEVKEAISSYNGAKRRFQIKGKPNRITVIEDYAHHPTEIRATLEAAFGLNPRRLIAVFQPHRYSRTKYFKDLLASSLFGADHIILTDIYSASEKPIKGVDSNIIYEDLLKKGHKKVKLISKDKITSYLVKIVKPDDLVLIMGAGDIGEVSDELVQRLKEQSPYQGESL